MNYQGNILKMRTEPASPIRYFLPVGENEINMNELIGKKISMRFSGQINCIACGKQTKRSFSQGFCYKCLQTAPEAGESILRPELSKAHFGIGRDIQWAEKYDLIEHVVYLAASSEIKVGVTRHHQIPSRWIDQGASYAVKLAKTPNRHIAGVMEVFLKKYYTDRTNWQAMLKNLPVEGVDILEEKKKIEQLLPRGLRKYIDPDNAITYLDYPVQQYPEKITNWGFDKQPSVEGILTGIKGQYLIFDNCSVLNVRKHNGYFLTIESPSYTIL
ncbi:MAG: DUF2797 domain-containing protein [Prolixibacteraceae bacterium]